MRFITGMLTVSLVCGCGQAEDATNPVASPRVTETASVSSALRIGAGGKPSFITPQLRRTLSKGAARLSDLQADAIGDNARNGLDDDDPDDGGWDFTFPSSATSHTSTASPENTYGATALGVWAAVRAGADAQRYRTTLLGAGLGSQQRPEIDSSTDFVFLPLLGELAEDQGFSELARARYDAKVAAAGGVQALAEQARDVRHSQKLDALVLYDLTWYMLGAESLDAAFPGYGYGKDADTYANVAAGAVTSSPPLFDVDDAGQRNYVQGLAWSLVIFHHAGAPAALVTKIRSHLRDFQGADGAWGYNAATPADDLQSTAHAVEALSLTAGRDVQARLEALRGAGWLVRKQAANGGWEYTAGSESSLIDAESMLALYLSHVAAPGGALEPGATSDIGQTAQALSAPTAPAGTTLAAPPK
ncbi:MAG TPA: prenyltransferase/squalene oxidase repeat-containing protein [Polyangiaceae bacterium]|nr:prenyltransferase/squalene oxidase repeat-containing protein [Polyangiaceae bacterium]